jgi:hypothetical protein
VACEDAIVQPVGGGGVPKAGTLWRHLMDLCIWLKCCGPSHIKGNEFCIRAGEGYRFCGGSTGRRYGAGLLDFDLWIPFRPVLCTFQQLLLLWKDRL